MELMQAHEQWKSRPYDERFLSLDEMSLALNDRRRNSTSRVIASRQLSAAPIEDDENAIAIVGPSGVAIAPTHWGFGQLAARAGAPVDYMRKLPSALAADCLNHGLQSRDIEDVSILLRRDTSGKATLASVNGPNYGRVWDSSFLDSLRARFGDGRTGPFKVPGEFGKQVAITKENTTLYASDRDMWVFLADEENRIEMPNRRNGKSGSLARGFFAWNSEVGSQTFGVATFLFDYVCSNRIIWDAAEFKEIRIRHTASAPEKLMSEVAPALQRYAQAGSVSITQALTDARNARLDDVDAFLVQRKFTRPQVAAIKRAHLEDEGRPVESIWDVVTGATAYARTLEHQDSRVALERQAGQLLKLAA